MGAGLQWPLKETFVTPGEQQVKAAAAAEEKVGVRRSAFTPDLGGGNKTA